MGWVNATVDFEKVEVTTAYLEPGIPEEPYSFQLEAAGGTPPYEWSLLIEYDEEQTTGSFPAITTNQLQPTNDDDGFATLPLDFDFFFYGEIYNELTILTDGAITFDGIFSYIRDDPAVMGNKCITAYCSDLMIYPSQGDGIFYDGNSEQMTIRWKTSKFDEPGFDVDVAVTLHADGSIEFFYNDGITPSTEWSAGISLGDGNSYLIGTIAGQVNIPDEYTATFESTPFPAGMEITADGTFHGSPTQATTWEIPFMVTDYNRISGIKTLLFQTIGIGYDELPATEDHAVEVFPNPAKDKLTFSFAQSGEYTVELFDFSGKKIAQVFEGRAGSGQQISWNAKELPAGTYLLRWKNKSQSGSRKILLTN